MKNQIMRIIVGLGILCAFSFTPVTNENEEFSSTYSFVQSGEDNALIKLQLNEDSTFEFLDNSNPDRQIEAKGRYEIKGRIIRLFNYNSSHPISEVWKKDKDFNCIQSRKGLKWTRICGKD